MDEYSVQYRKISMGFSLALTRILLTSGGITVPAISKVNVAVKSTSASTPTVSVTSSFALSSPAQERVSLNKVTLLSKEMLALPDFESSNFVGLGIEKSGPLATTSGLVEATKVNSTFWPLKE